MGPSRDGRDADDVEHHPRVGDHHFVRLVAATVHRWGATAPATLPLLNMEGGHALGRLWSGATGMGGAFIPDQMVSRERAKISSWRSSLDGVATPGRPLAPSIGQARCGAGGSR
jgi:hypothetical protein